MIEPNPSIERGGDRRSGTYSAIAVSVFLIVAVAVVFGQTLHFGFCNLDDAIYVRGEPHVFTGLSWSNLVWALTSGPAGDWCPLAALSHMLDCDLWELNPAGHHLTNLLLHATSAVTLFWVWWRMNDQRAVPAVAQASGVRVGPADPIAKTLWPSALVAALFAIHPLRVESVAWIAERRDVLSGLFFMLTLGAYGEYVRRPQSLARYLAVAGLLTLGLLTKSMLVTLPPLLLLLDFWPLRRFRAGGFQTIEPGSLQQFSLSRLVVEKLPLFALAIAAAVVTMLTHDNGANPLTVPERLADAAISCVAYLWELFVPVNLSFHYVYPETGWPIWQVAAASALLLALTVAAVMGRRSCPYFTVGWFWYLGLLVPVLGLIYVGPHSRADRYTYLSQIGLYIALVWGVMRLSAAWPARRWVLGIASAIVLLTLMACAWRQTRYWQDDQTLWEHTLACEPENVTAHFLLGCALWETDQPGATKHFQAALKLGPTGYRVYHSIWAQAHNRLGAIAADKGDLADAQAHYESAVQAEPSFVMARTNLGSLLIRMGDLDRAMTCFQESLALRPDDPLTLCCLAVAQAQQGNVDLAIASLRKAVEGDPNFLAAQTNLAAYLAQQGQVAEAIEHYRRALEIDPNSAAAKQGLERLRQR